MEPITFLLILLIVLLFVGFPIWPHSTTWGYGPSGLAGFLIVVLLLFLLFD